MKYTLIDSKVKQFIFSPSGVKIAPNTQLKITTQIGRGQTKLDDTHYEVALHAQIVNNEENPVPFNLAAEYAGLFEVTEVKGDADIRKFLTEASKVLYPHLCALFSNVSTIARLPGLQLPFKSGAIFPEDEERFAFVVGGNDGGNNNANKPN